jgi:hypothetical protein
MVLDRNIRNIPVMKNITPKAHSHPLYTAGHTIHILDKAKTAPARCVHVLPCSLLDGNLCDIILFLP